MFFNFFLLSSQTLLTRLRKVSEKGVCVMMMVHGAMMWSPGNTGSDDDGDETTVERWGGHTDGGSYPVRSSRNWVARRRGGGGVRSL